MREILFRGKRKDNGEWTYGYLAGYDLICPDYPGDVSGVLGNYYDKTPYVGFIEVIPETVGQFTGLTDKNGTKIFEGDIVKPTFYSFFSGNKPEVVRWETDNNCGFEPYSDSIQNCGHCGGGVPPEDTVIIGNIHDNPELLEELEK